MQPAPSAGKRVRARHDWFWFGFLLVEKVARENACERDTIGFGLASYWLKKWREVCHPITEHSKANVPLLWTLN